MEGKWFKHGDVSMFEHVMKQQENLSTQEVM